MTEVLAYHGWGFSSKVWSKWTQMLDQLGLRFATFDRGYFGEHIDVNFKHNGSAKIILCHSYGLHFVPGSELKRADYLILFNSFVNMTGSGPDEGRVSDRLKLMIRAMEQKLQTSPGAVLSEFRNACYNGTEHEEPAPPYRTDLLLQDLRDMRNSNEVQTVGDPDLETIVFESGDDRILMREHRKELENRFNVVGYESVKDEGHALPFTSASYCFSVIKNVIPIFG